MADTNVPMTHPASVVKNPDGTYSVRVQHTVGGEYSDVNFPHRVFGEIMANGYAAVLNGTAIVESTIDKALAEPAVVEATADVKKLLADAQAEAQKLIDAAKTEGKSLLADAKTEAGKLKSDAQALYEETKNEAEKLLDEARTEASKLLKTASEKVASPAPTPEPAPAPAAKTIEEE
jgi:vacuolar-type H+-ATPase subunit H